MKKCLLITDLDNTLFDWVEIWYRSFSAMLESVIEKTGFDEDELKKEIRDVHRRHGTSEYAFVLNEVPMLKKYVGDKGVLDVFSEAIDAYRVARSQALHLYPEVMDTLLELRARGCKIIGYTESMAFYTNYRVRKLGLDGILDVIFSPKDHDLPKNMDLDSVRRYSSFHYEFKYTRHEHTPDGELKPNPHILLEIVEKAGRSAGECVYVGDSLHKDVAMAIDAGIDHAWAKYGLAQQRPEYALLREVTHWTDQDVQREKEVRERDVNPNILLDKKFSQILDHFCFGGGRDVETQIHQ